MIRASIQRSRDGRFDGRPLGLPGAVLAALGGFLFGVSACDPVLELQGSVVIPHSVQAQFSAAKRGRVNVIASFEGGGFPHLAWATLCEASDKPLVVPFRLSKVGCPKQVQIEALVERLPENDAEPTPACGLGSYPIRVQREAVVASAKRRVSAASGHCEGTRVSVEIVMPE